MAAALGVKSYNIKVVAVYKGSVVVDFEVDVENDVEKDTRYFED
jgi:hypothetical protein